MPIDLSEILAAAFLVSDARAANEALAEARERFAARPDSKSFSFEAVVPAVPDRAWLESDLLRKLVYHCESTRSPLPECAGIFVSLFVGERLHCVSAADFVRWAGEVLGLSSEEMVARFGTGEVRHPVGPPAGLLPGDGP